MQRAIEADELGLPLPADLPAWPATTPAGRARRLQGHQQAAVRFEKKAFRWQERQQVYVCPQGQTLAFERNGSLPDNQGRRIPCKVYRCPGEICSNCPDQQKFAKNAQTGRMVTRYQGEELNEQLQLRMAQAEAQELYKRRKETIERIYADWKEHRGLRRISGRGESRARV